MIVAPGRWFRNIHTGNVCVCLRVVAPWVWVRYQSGVEQKYHRDQFLKSFQNCMTPAPAGKRD